NPGETITPPIRVRGPPTIIELPFNQKKPAKFVTPVNGIIKFMETQQGTTFVICSRSKQLTIARLKSTIDPDIVVIKTEDISKELPDTNFAICYSESVANKLLQTSKNANTKHICVYHNSSEELKKLNRYQIHYDDIVWNDLSNDFQNTLILHAEVKSEIFDLPVESYLELKNDELVAFIRENNYSKEEVYESINNHMNEYLSKNASLGLHEIPSSAVTNLHVAVRQGYPVITNLLLNLKNDAELQEHLYLMHFCVVDSKWDADALLLRKEKVLELLLKENAHWVNEIFPNGTPPLLQRNVHKRLIECLVKQGADCTIALEFGKGLTVEVIRIMEDQGLQISKQLSSNTLKGLICNKQIKAWELDCNFVQVADYLIDKGACFLCKNGKSPWEMDAVQKNMRKISKCIDDESLQNELITRKRNEMKKVAESKCEDEKSYALQDKRSFEKLCISLVACRQVEPYVLLKLCLQSEINYLPKFITPPVGISQLFLTKECNVVVLKSCHIDVSISRIQETVDIDAEVVSESDLNNDFHLQHGTNLAIFKCQKASVKTIQRLVELPCKSICLCNDVDTELEDSQFCKILKDEFSWWDISADFQNKHHQAIQSELLKSQDVDSMLIKPDSIEKSCLDYTFSSLLDILASANEKELQLITARAEKCVLKCCEEYSKAMKGEVKSCKNKHDFLAKHNEFHLIAADSLKTKWSDISNSHLFYAKFKKTLNDVVDAQFKELFDHFEFTKEHECTKTTSMKQEVRNCYHDEIKKHMQNHFVQPQILETLHERARQTALDRCKHSAAWTDPQITIMQEALKQSFNKYKEENTMMLNHESGYNPAIGIDFGTTSCSAAVFYARKIVVIKSPEERNTVASCVAFSSDGTHTVGDSAKENAFRNPKNTIYDTKRIIGRRFLDPQLQNDMQLWPFTVVKGEEGPEIEIYGKQYLPEQIAAIILKELVKQAEKVLGVTIKSAVVTVPGHFTNSQREATKEAVEIAGLELLEILDEPTACMLAYKLETFYDDTRIALIFDLGGDRLNLSILQIDGNEIKILLTDVVPKVGGKYFDVAVVEYCLNEFKKQHGDNVFDEINSTQVPKDDDAKQRLRRLQYYCERAKITIDVANSSLISVNAFHKDKNLEVTITRQKFEELNTKHFNRILETVERSLNRVGLSKTDIDDIVLAGGSTRIPIIRRILTQYFSGKSLNHTVQPNEAVACGAAVRAALLNGLKTMNELVFCSIDEQNSNSLETEASIEEIEHPKTVCKEIYSTFEHNQGNTVLRISQADAVGARDCGFLAELELSTNTVAYAGNECIDVIMETDNLGVFNVKAVVKSTKEVLKVNYKEVPSARRRISTTNSLPEDHNF
ncbi:Heat shock cognate 71 kDa protein, partial [Orchesella cincta]